MRPSGGSKGDSGESWPGDSWEVWVMAWGWVDLHDPGKRGSKERGKVTCEKVEDESNKLKHQLIQISSTNADTRDELDMVWCLEGSNPGLARGGGPHSKRRHGQDNRAKREKTGYQRG